MEEMNEENEYYHIFDSGYYFSSLLLSRALHALFPTEMRKAHPGTDKLKTGGESLGSIPNSSCSPDKRKQPQKEEPWARDGATAGYLADHCVNT